MGTEKSIHDPSNLILNCYQSLLGNREEKIAWITEWVHELRSLDPAIPTMEYVTKCVEDATWLKT